MIRVTKVYTFLEWTTLLLSSDLRTHSLLLTSTCDLRERAAEMPSHRKHRGRNKRRDTTSISSSPPPSEPPPRSTGPSHVRRKPRAKKPGAKVADPMVEYEKRQSITDCWLLSHEVLRLCRNVRVQNPVYRGTSDLYIYKLHLCADYPPDYAPGMKLCSIFGASEKKRSRPSAKQRRQRNF